MHFTPTGITLHGPPNVTNLSSQVNRYRVWETHGNHGTSQKVPYKHPLAPFLKGTNLSSNLCFFWGVMFLLLIVFNVCKMHSSTTQKEKLVWFYRFMSLIKGTPSLYIMVPCKFQAPTLPRYIGNPNCRMDSQRHETSNSRSQHQRNLTSRSTSWDRRVKKNRRNHCGDKVQGHKGFVSKHFSRFFFFGRVPLWNKDE